MVFYENVWENKIWMGKLWKWEERYLWNEIWSFFLRCSHFRYGSWRFTCLLWVSLTAWKDQQREFERSRKWFYRRTNDYVHIFVSVFNANFFTTLTGIYGNVRIHRIAKLSPTTSPSWGVRLFYMYLYPTQEQKKPALLWTHLSYI